MSILRDDRSVARQEVLEAGWSGVDHLQALADNLEDRALARELEALADATRERLQRLEEAVRRSGELPVLPDRDRETVEEFIDWASSVLSTQDGPRPVLRPRMEAEQHFAELIEQHLANQAFSADERQVLESLRDQAIAGHRRLAELSDTSLG